MSNQHKGVLAWFASNPVAANLLMVIILVSGAMAFSNLRLESFPSLPPSSIEVEVSFDSASAAVAEESISLKIEQALQGVVGIKSLTTIASGDGVTATIERTSGYDLDKLLKDVKARIDAISTLPTKALTPITTAQTFQEDAVRIQLWGEVNQDILQNNSRRLRKELLKDPAIDSVDYIGRKTPEVRIQLDVQKLAALGLTIAEVGAKIAVSSTSASAGELFSQRGKLLIKANQQGYWQRDFADIIVMNNSDGMQIRLGDVASIEDSYQQSGNLSRFNGKPALGLSLRLGKHSDVNKIAIAVRKKVALFRAHIPQGLNITVWEDKSSYIQSRLDLLIKNSLQGVFLVMLLLALFLNVRLAFWVGLGLPVIFTGAALLMSPFAYDLTLNELTTFGFIMALGIVVDDAVVVSESIYSSREKDGATLAATINGVKRVSVPTIFGVLTTIVAFMSMTFIEGEMGQIFANFAYAAAFCLVFSMLESKLILPAHLAHLNMKPSNKNNPISAFFTIIQQAFKRALHYFTFHIYRPFMHVAIKHKYSVIICAIAVLIAVCGMLPAGKVRFIFFPNIPSDTVSISIEFAKDAPPILVQRQSLEVERVITKLSEEIYNTRDLSEPPVRNLMLNIADSEASLIAELSPRKSRPIDTDQIVEQWRSSLLSLEGVVRIDFISNFGDSGDIDIELAAADGELLASSAQEVVMKLSTFTGVSAVKSSLQLGVAQYELALTAHGNALNIDLISVIEQVQNAVQGYEVQRIQRNAGEVKVMLRYHDDQRRNRYDLERILISDTKGNRFELSTIATIKSTVAQQSVYRVNSNRVANITANIDKNKVSGEQVLQLLQSNVLDILIAQNPELIINLRGEAEDKAETTSSMRYVFIVALLLIYALLAIPLSSYFQPLIIMLAIPFGIVGAILGHWFHAVPISLLSLFGILALCGVVVNDSLLLMTTYNQLKIKGLTSRVAVIHAACGRMRAIVLTSSTTFIGLLPLISETSEQAQFLIPAAISMGYGILFATVITLIIIPVSILIADDIGKFKSFKRKKHQKIAPSLEPLL